MGFALVSELDNGAFSSHAKAVPHDKWPFSCDVVRQQCVMLDLVQLLQGPSTGAQLRAAQLLSNFVSS